MAKAKKEDKNKGGDVKPVGRPTDYSFELAKSICERLSNGEKLPDLLSEEGMPVRSTFFKWKRENKEFSDLYVNVAQDKGELCIEEIDATVDDLRKGKIDPSTANVIIQTLKWKAAKFYPKMYGEKVDVTSGGEPLNNNKLDLNNVPIETLLELARHFNDTK